MDLKKELKTNKDFQKIVKDSFLDLFENDKFIALMKRFIFSNLTKDEFENINPKKAFAISSLTRTTFMELINLNCLENDVSIQIANESDFNELVPVIEEILQNDSEFMNNIKIKMEEVAKEYSEKNNLTEISPYTLSKKDDKIGDVTEINNRFSVDLGMRDAPFVFLNGNIEIGRESDTHSILLTRLVNNIESSPKYVRGKEAFDMTGDNELAFGHIANGLAFLEVLDNVNEDEVVNKLINLPDINKVYDYREYTDKITRLAKLF